MLPIDFVSLKSAVYWALVRLGGPPGRNCEGDAMAQGVMVAICGATPGARAGGVGRHTPGVVPPRNGGSTVENPSVLRQAQMASATDCPHSMPRSMDSLCSAAGPLAISSRERVRFWV